MSRFCFIGFDRHKVCGLSIVICDEPRNESKVITFTQWTYNLLALRLSFTYANWKYWIHKAHWTERIRVEWDNPKLLKILFRILTISEGKTETWKFLHVHGFFTVNFNFTEILIDDLKANYYHSLTAVFQEITVEYWTLTRLSPIKWKFTVEKEFFIVGDFIPFESDSSAFIQIQIFNHIQGCCQFIICYLRKHQPNERSTSKPCGWFFRRNIYLES